MTKLILYSKPGCHLCEGLQEKLEQLPNLEFELEIRDITTREDWFQAYQYEIPVLMLERRAEGRGQKAEEGQKAEGRGQKVGEGQKAETQFIASVQGIESPLPRLSPRATVQQVEQMLQKYGVKNR